MLSVTFKFFYLILHYLDHVFCSHYPRQMCNTSPSIIVFSSLSYLNMCPIILFLLDWMLLHNYPSSFILSSTSSLVKLSVQGILSLFLKLHILKALNLFLSIVLIVQVSHPFVYKCSFCLRYSGDYICFATAIFCNIAS